MNSLHLNGILGLFVAVYGVILLVAGITVDFGALRYVSTAIGIVGILIALFDRWLWKLPWLHPWLVPMPDISGTWQGSLSTSYDGPVGERRRECYLVVRQTFSRVSVVLITSESESKDLAAAVYHDNADGRTLAVTYENVPQLRHRERSAMHLGGMVLRIRGIPPSLLDGEYFTSRSTVGEVAFQTRSSALASTITEARGLFA